MFEPDPIQDNKPKQTTSFNSFVNNNNRATSNKNNSGISDYNAQFLQRMSAPNYVKLNSSSNSTVPQNNNSQSNNRMFESPSTTSSVNGMFSSALSHTFQNIPNTFSNLTNPFGVNSLNNTKQQPQNFFGSQNTIQDNRPKSSFSNVFGINPSPNSFGANITQPRNQIEINQFQLSVAINTFETKIDRTEEVVFFKIDLYSNITKNEWSVFHKYNDFYELNLIFKKYYVKAPYFPGQSITRLSNISELTHRKENLQKYLKDVINRPDLLTSVYCIKFLKLENHYPDMGLYHPLLMYNLENELELPISCAYFYEETNLLFLGLGKPKESALGGIFDKVKSGFGFFKKAEPQKVICGQLVIYNIIKNYQGLCHFEPLFAKPLYSECVSINYYKEKNCLCLGLNDGTVQLYKVFTTESTQESQGQFVIEAGTINCHKVPIVGSVVNFNYGYIYTVAKETVIKISELNYQTLMKEIPITKRNITKMQYENRMGRMILGDEGGSIYIVDMTTNVLLPQVCKIINSKMVPITCLSCDFIENRLFVGFKGGNVIFYKITNYNDKFTANVDLIKMKEITISNDVNVNDVIVTGKDEMLFSLSNGSIPVYTDNFDTPECIIYYIIII